MTAQCVGNDLPNVVQAIVGLSGTCAVFFYMKGDVDQDEENYFCGAFCVENYNFVEDVFAKQRGCQRSF